jgi:hypothetical protein
MPTLPYEYEAIGLKHDWDKSIILDFGSRWRRVMSLTSWSLYLWGKSSLHPLDRGMVGLDVVEQRYSICFVHVPQI